ncbi:glycoside hydrolase family 17 protein [Gelatoporia subvermispora B]|uniref:glucan endo-1,3-beta-D-glucosidase n=1 Tax=Ceriporiopsis subvermispora (strain B) TaxID=914234 RepID=M2QAM1_CERS8|nr:glycoside hydrolase family 17 protein [Gelatoporia subvermispora B]
MPADSNGGYANMESPYNNSAYSQSQWLEKQESRSKRSKCIVVTSLIALVVLIAAGVTVGVLLSRKHSSSSSSSPSSSSAATTVGPSGVVNQTDPNDPSTFVPDSRLKHSFYGLAYTPAGSQLPECGNSLDQVIEDIQLISQLTSRIRLYGADCNQSALVLEAIERTKVNMSVWLAVYNVPTNATAYSEQRDKIVDAIKTYGTDHIAGVTVGNEFILDYLSAYGDGTDTPNGPIGNQGAALLNSNITDMKNTLANMGVSLQVGTSDAGSYFNNEVLENVDYGMANVHPWFANVSIDQAADWTYNFFQTQDVAVANALPNAPKMYIAETGWPTNSSDAGNESNGPSTASEPNLQTFLDTFVCQANQNGTDYFFFEFFDETWKLIQFGGVEGYWGLFYANKTLKDITIPNCEID